MRRLLLLLAVGLLLAGCQKERPVTEPAGGYEAFVEALMAGDAQATWSTLSSETHLLFEDSYATLQSMEALCARLRPSDRAEARRQTGVALLGQITSAEQLFRYVFYQENIPAELPYRLGLHVKRVEMVDETHATIHTRADQQFEMVLEDDGVWRLKTPLHEIFAGAMEKLQVNRANLETAVTLFGNADDDAEIERLLGPGATGVP